MSTFSFAIVSDIHVYVSGSVPSNFTKVMAQVAGLTPRFVVLSGDGTSGNPDDGASRDKVALWWRAFRGACQPLVDRDIPILPIAGNHDYYTSAQRDGYQAAWASLSEEVSDRFILSGRPPLYYSLQVDELRLTMLHVVDQALPSDVAQFVRQDAAETPEGSLKLCIGHVPLVSMMGKTSESYRDELGSLLVDTGHSAFFAGHEHLVWEQSLSFRSGDLHHVHVGTGSGTYHFPLSRATYDKHCTGNEGTLPYNGRRFALDPGTRQQADKTNICMVQISDGTYSVEHLTLRGGELQRFGLP